MNNIPDPKNIRNISLRELFGIPIPNPSPERKEDTPHCDNWKTWGRTITREDCVGAISCSIYGRLTWPQPLG